MTRISASFDMVLGILTGTGLFAVFLTYRFFGLKVPDPLSAIDQKIFLRCPRCLKEQDVPVGESHCMACRLRITVDIEEPKCPKCGYNLRALTRPICPECGASIVPEEVDPQAALLKWRRKPTIKRLVVLRNGKRFLSGKFKNPQMIAIVAAVLLIIASLWAAKMNDANSLSSVGTVAKSVSAAMVYELWYSGPLFLLAGMIMGVTARPKIAILILGVACVLAFAMLFGIPAAMTVPPRTYVERLLSLAHTGSTMAYFISMGLLLSQNIRPPLSWIKWTTVSLLTLSKAITFIEVLWRFYASWLDIVVMALYVASMAFVLLASWHMAFRQGKRHMPPLDSARAVKLTCPRCESAQEILTGHGECANCCLQISIALEEGVCRGCGYLLRGLTSEACPECGRPIVRAGAGVAQTATIP